MDFRSISGSAYVPTKYGTSRYHASTQRPRPSFACEWKRGDSTWERGTERMSRFENGLRGIFHAVLGAPARKRRRRISILDELEGRIPPASIGTPVPGGGTGTTGTGTTGTGTGTTGTGTGTTGTGTGTTGTGTGTSGGCTGHNGSGTGSGSTSGSGSVSPTTSGGSGGSTHPAPPPPRHH